MKVPINPKHPERICWGCDKLCPVDDLACGNGKERARHPSEDDEGWITLYPELVQVSGIGNARGIEGPKPFVPEK